MAVGDPDLDVLDSNVAGGVAIRGGALRTDGLQKLFEVSALLRAVGALCPAIGAQVAIDVVAGPKFQASAPVLRLQALALLTSFFAATWSFALRLLKRYFGLAFLLRAVPPELLNAVLRRDPAPDDA